NANNSGGACSFPPSSGSQVGIDLNRNASWRWGLEGVSFFACDLTYPGTGPSSEPEQQALEALFTQLFRDQRGPADTDAAPITTTGAMLTLHSYSNLVLLPWGDSGASAPNDTGLRTLAYRMSYYNWYQTGRPAEVLYGVTGASDDFVYGTLGVPGFTWEMGFSGGSLNYPTCAGFTPAYACQDARFWPEARQGLLYLAKAARQPYALALGPTVLSVSVMPSVTRPGASTQVQARLADNALGGEPGSVARPSAQMIGAAEVYLDTPPWLGGSPIPLTAKDGGFDQVRETVIGSVTAPTATGRHTLYARGRDADGNWGPVTAMWLFVDDQLATPTPTPTGAPPTATPTPAPAACMLAPLLGTLAITDSLGVMNCGSITVLADTSITTLSLRLAANHTYVGDLRLQLRAPDGTALTLMSLPGMPGPGYSGKLSASYPITFADGAPYPAEQMGQGGPLVCGSDGFCRFSPAPDGDPYSDVGAFAAFVGSSATGAWQVCIADHYPADTGSITSAALLINCDGAAPTPTGTPTPTATASSTPTVTATPMPAQLLYYFPRVTR
ncbi:MAG: M14 family zinc carboxypeptidase, partial [Thermoflexales bacterium]